MRCFIQSCSYEPGKRHFRLPKNPYRRKLWLEKINDPAIEQKANARLCEIHFEERFKKPQPYPGASVWLLPGAVPTLHLNPPAKPALTSYSLDSVSNETFINETFSNETDESPNVSSDEEEIIQIDISKYRPKYRQVKCITGSSKSARVYIQRKTNSLFHGPSFRSRGFKARSLVQQLEQSIAKQKLAVKPFKRKILHKCLLQYRKTNDVRVLKEIFGNLSTPLKKFLRTQTRYPQHIAKQTRFTLVQKLFSIHLYMQCPQGYKNLLKTIHLPSVNTIKRTLDVINLEPGISDTMFRNLKLSVEKILPCSFSKNCLLLFDIMKVKPGVGYSYVNDTIYGFEDFGCGKRSNFADHVLVFMIRGLTESWTQPLAYMFFAGPVKPNLLTYLIRKLLSELFYAGLQVVATVSDSAAVNVQTIEIFKKESRLYFLRRGVLLSSVGYYIEGREIFHIYDPPHLLKSVRNQLLTKNLRFKFEKKTYIARWRDLIDFYNYDCTQSEDRRCGKLTVSHIIPRQIPKKNIKYCVQVFSRTVAVSMSNLLKEADPSVHNLSETALGTAKLCRFFDTLFDSINGFGYPSSLKPLFSTVTDTSSHIKFWNMAEEVLKSMEFINKSDKVFVTPSITRWIETVQAIKALWQNLKNSGFHSFSPKTLNVCPLKNFLSRIRSQGNFSSSPTCDNFRYSFNSLLIDNVLVPSLERNNEDETDEILVSLETIIENHKNTPQVSPNLSMDLLPPSDKEILVDFLENLYASGQVARRILKISKTQKCKRCRSILTNTKQNVCNTEPESSDLPINLYRQTTSTLLRLMPYVCHMTGIRKGFSFLIKNNVDVFRVNCGEHDLTDAFIMYCSKLIIYFWCNTVKNILSGQEIGFPQMDDVQKAALDVYESRLVQTKKLKMKHEPYF